MKYFPIVFNIGIQYNPHEKITILVELEKDIEHPFNFKGGFEYKIVDQFRARGGFNNKSGLIFFRRRLLSEKFHGN